MEDANRKKLFTAELQRLRQHGKPAPAPEFAKGDPGNLAVLQAVRALRDELKALERRMFPDDAPAPEPDPAGEALLQQRAEVEILRTELRALAMCIQQTKVEISALRPRDADDDRLVAVTFELDAIVTSTERATQTILDAAERIDAAAAAVAAHGADSFVKRQTDDIREQVIEIFESCNFQDITGQRITKVVNTLKYVEDRINAMIEIWGAESFADLQRAEDEHEDEEAKLLNGPQLDNKGISQAEIDKLFG